VTVYFHTQIVTTKNHVCVLEATINDINKMNKCIIKTEPIGFAVFPCAKITKTVNTPFYNGSVIFLLEYDFEDLDRLAELLKYKIEVGDGL